MSGVLVNWINDWPSFTRFPVMFVPRRPLVELPQSWDVACGFWAINSTEKLTVKKTSWAKPHSFKNLVGNHGNWISHGRQEDVRKPASIINDHSYL